MKRYLIAIALLSIVLLLGITYLAAQKGQTRSEIITILHFNDTHSYWYPHGRRKWGGFARLATEIKNLKASIANPVYVMVAGDVMEGKFYNRCDSGGCDLQLLDAMGVDYLVIGNHDWLMGPYNQYSTFEKARPQMRILACNIEYTHYDTSAGVYRDLPPEYALSNYIRPYAIFSAYGKKIGLVGITTYQYIYDPYYFPVTLRDPNYAVSETVDKLYNEQNCNVILALSHLGLSGDHNLYGFAIPYCPGDGISVIIGGHSHTKVFPAQVDGSCSLGQTKLPAEIVQAWCHAKLLGRVDIDLSNLDTPIVNYELHQIDSSITPDPEVKSMVDDFAADTVRDQNIPSDDNILRMNVDLYKIYAETKLTDMICDAYIWKMNQIGKPVDIALFNTDFVTDHLERVNFLPAPQDDYSYFSSVDIYNVIPHTYDPSRKVSWLLSKYELYGWELKFLLETSLSYAFTTVSGNVEVVYDPSKANGGDKAEKSIDTFKINGENIDSWSRYTFVVDEGLKAALDQLNVQPVEVTNVEAWKAYRDYIRHVVKHIDRGSNSDIDGRIRTSQPDPVVFESYITFSNDHPTSGDIVTITAKIKNWGSQTASSGTVKFYYDYTPDNFVDDPSYQLIGTTYFSDLPAQPTAGYSITKSIQWDTTGLPSGLYPIYVEISNVPNEQEKDNNTAQAFLQLN